MACYLCGSEHAPHLVEEVWFDIPGMEGAARFASTKEWENKPSVCDTCREPRAHEIANLVAGIQAEAGAFGPIIPSGWHVRYSDGMTMGGKTSTT